MPSRDELDKLRYRIDMRLLSEKDKDQLTPQSTRLFDLAHGYKEAGLLRDAVCEMRRSLRLSANDDYKAVLVEWERELGIASRECPYRCGEKFSVTSLESCTRCNRLVVLCSMCNYHNRLYDPYCRWCGSQILHSQKKEFKMSNLVIDWFYSFPIESIVPPPVMVGDLIIFNALRKRELIALKASNGELAWRGNILVSDRNIGQTFSYPYLYMYSTKRIVRNIVELDSRVSETIYNNGDVITTDPSFPLIDRQNHTILFPVSKGLLCHDIWRLKRNLIEIELEENDYLFPLMSGNQIYVFSRKGKIYRMKSGQLESLGSVPGCRFIGPPTCAQDSTWIYFESYCEGKRVINVWIPSRNEFLSTPLPQDLCSVDDPHFQSPPFAFKDGVLLISCQKPRLYHLYVIEGSIDVREIEVDVSVGIKKVLGIEHLFSLILDPYIISRVVDGFFYLNIEDGADFGMEFFGNEIMSRPVFINNRLVLMCKDGVRCYRL